MRVCINDYFSPGVVHCISTNAKYPRLEISYKMLIDHLHRMAQAI